MPYCPQCKDEFREEIKVCPECEVALVAALPKEIEPEMEDLEVACTIPEEQTAYIIRGYLESEGIPCQMENVTFHAAPGGALTRVRLWVKKTDVPRTRKLMEDHEEFNYCSSCGHVAAAQDAACDFCGEPFEN